METRRTKRGPSRKKKTSGAFAFVVHSGDEEGCGEKVPPHCVLMKAENPTDGSPPLKPVWNNDIIPPALNPVTTLLEIDPVSEAYVLSRNETLLFSGKRGKNEGWSLDEAQRLAQALTSGDLEWVGGPIDSRGRALTLESGSVRIKEVVKEKRRDKLKEKRSPKSPLPFRKHRRARRNSSAYDSDSSEISFHSVETNRDGPAGDITERSEGDSSEDDLSDASSVPRSRAGRRKLAKREKANQPKGTAPGKIFLPFFSGENSTDPQNASFKTWRYDVEIYRLQGASERHLLPRVIASLRGAPGEMVRSLGTRVSLATILKTLDGYYGDVLTADGMIQELYTISQNEGESVAEFGMRVEKVVSMITELFPDELDPGQKLDKIKNRFFAGLDPEIKSAIAYLKKRPGILYEDLLREAREVEKDSERVSNKKHSSQFKRSFEPRKDARNWHPFSSRKPNGFAVKSLKADLAEIHDAMIGEPEVIGSEGEDEDEATVKAQQTVQLMKGALNMGDAKPKNPWDKFKKNERKPGAKDPMSYKCLNCLGFGHFARECPSPYLKDSKNEKGEGDRTKPFQPQSRSTNNPYEGTTLTEEIPHLMQNAAMGIKHGYWEVPLDNPKDSNDQ